MINLNNTNNGFTLAAVNGTSLDSNAAIESSDGNATSACTMELTALNTFKSNIFFC